MKVPWSEHAWQRVLVYGMGRSGMAAARLLRSRGVRVVGVDARDDLESGDLSGDPGVELRLGEGEDQLPEGIDGMVLSPGIPRTRPLVRQALARGLPVIGEAELAFPFLDGTIVAVTGSNGKSTTASLVAAILGAAGLEGVLCGNIGEPLSSKVDGAGDRIYVVELSSFQLESIRCFRADAAALLNITPDHLDRYPDLAHYAAAKARIFERQDETCTAVLNADDSALESVARGVERARRRFFSRRRAVADGCFSDGEVVLEASPGSSPRELFELDEIVLEGVHNVENAMAAALLALACGAGREGIRQGVRAFSGLPHRLERVETRAGVLWYDDSKGTNVGATLGSLAGFPDGTVHLILGGTGKGADFALLRDAVARKARRVYLIGEAAPGLEEALSSAVQLERAETLERAVASAASEARAGEVVLLSPACASFDQFASFEHRGRRFQELVRALDHEEADGQEARL